MPDGDLGVELDAHLKVPLQGRLGNGPGTVDGGGIALEAIHHGIQIPLLWHLARRCRGGSQRGTVDGLMEDGRLGIMGLHGLEVVSALQQMGALPTGVLGANGLTIQTLCGHALFRCYFQCPPGQSRGMMKKPREKDDDDDKDDDMQGWERAVIGILGGGRGQRWGGRGRMAESGN